MTKYQVFTSVVFLFLFTGSVCCASTGNVNDEIAKLEREIKTLQMQYDFYRELDNPDNILLTHSFISAVPLEREKAIQLITNTYLYEILLYGGRPSKDELQQRIQEILKLSDLMRRPAGKRCGRSRK